MKGWIVAGTILFIGLIVLMMWGCPTYGVWQQAKSGEAELRKAEFSKQIIQKEAEARMIAAESDAQAEIIRARGMAEAMEIENGQLTPTYNQYLFIRNMTEFAEAGNATIIYVPTETMIPILEANRSP